jgi:hypothetical protein
MNKVPETTGHASERWTLIRDIAVLQAKLVVDGLRDLVLVPTSLIVGLVSLFSGEGGRPGAQFYQLLGIGKHSEQWIDLFGALRNAPADVTHIEPFPDARMGGITAQAKDRFDKAFDALHQKRKQDR